VSPAGKGRRKRPKKTATRSKVATDEVSALIKTLLVSGRRLEELTAGEVDSIADSQGRTFLLQRAQERNMTTGPEGLALVSIIINLAHSLKLHAVAEGVETTELSRLLRLLRLLHCDEMQGFLFSKPLPAATYELQYLSMDSETRVAASSQY
jgi:hypothetical protein